MYLLSQWWQLIYEFHFVFVLIWARPGFTLKHRVLKYILAAADFITTHNASSTQLPEYTYCEHDYYNLTLSN